MAKYFKKVTPESCGISSRDLLRFIEGMEDMPEEKETHGFMLIRHGKLLTEGWFSPYTEDMPHMLYSDTKTFVQLAIGFMVQEGLITIEDKVSDYFKDKLTEFSSEENKNLTIRHLLMMATGHGGQNVHTGGSFLEQKEDRIRDFFEFEMVSKPGTEFHYESEASYVLSCMVTRVTGKNIEQYLRPRFLEPLGITVNYYSADEEGNCMGFSGFRIKLEALAKVGQFLLKGGVWEGKRLLPKEWCEQATAKQIDCVGPCGEDWNQGYCWQMWRGRYNTARLCGAFGQMCVIMPDYDMVFATNSGANYNRLQNILNNFYENVMLKAKDCELEEDGVGNIKLEKKIETLSLRNIFAPISPRKNELDGKEFGFEKILSFDKLKLDFNGDVCNVTLSGDRSISFAAGLKEPQETFESDGGFVPIDPENKSIYSATAYFDEEDNFIITARILETITIVKIKITPDDKVELTTIRGSLN